MDLKQIHYFKAVADCESFAKASERLHISQPAISKQISQLETELNADLLVRHARGVRLTPAGKIFLAHGRDILARVEQARSAVAETVGEIAGTVTIAMMTTIANTFAAKLLERAKAKCPKLELKIFEALSGEISTWHSESRFDLSIMYLPDDHSMQGARSFVEEDLYLLSPITDEMKGETIDFKSVGNYPLHHTSRIHACRLLLDATANKMKVALNIVAEIDSITLLYEFTAKRNAYTVFPCVGRPPSFQREVSYRQIINPSLKLRSYVVPSANRANRKAMEAVTELLCDMAVENQRENTVRQIAALARCD